jgi:hypothetical protein
MAVAADDGAAGPQTPLEAIGIIAKQNVMIAPGLRHLELYTRRGLLTILWHEPPEDATGGAAAKPAALVLGGGAMGGLLGPAEGLYQRLGTEWAARGVAVLRVS